MSLLLTTAGPAIAQPVVNEAAQENTILFPGDPNEVVFSLPKRGLKASELLVVYNVEQQASIDIKDCYVSRRNIPSGNVLGLSVPTSAEISNDAGLALVYAIDAALEGRDDIQAVALAWHTPWRVNTPGSFVTPKKSITTYLARMPTSKNVYFDSPSSRPWTDHGVRPAMLITPEASENCGESGLIARGVQADSSMPDGNGFLLRTSDVSRSVRYKDFIDTVDAFADAPLNLEYQDLQSGPNDVAINNTNITSLEQLEMTGDFMSNESDVLFHFTGLATVPGIATNTFAPGAYADHLTSGAGAITFRGGDFFDCAPEPCTPPTYASTQMSALNWLENGATASYGNVYEPFATTLRFPNSTELVANYFYGGTVLEAVTKSVVDPSYGLAIGEPLARPFASRSGGTGGTPSVDTTALKPGHVYSVWSATESDGPLERIRSNMVVTEPAITNIAGAANARQVLLNEETDPFYLTEAVREDFFLCSFQTDNGTAWCDGDGNLWYRADGRDGQRITDRVMGNNAAAYGNTLYWLERPLTGSAANLYAQTLPDGLPALLATTSSDTPLNLVASGDLVVWVNNLYLDFPELVAYDIATAQVSTQLGGDVILWLGAQIALLDSTVSFVGGDIGANQYGVYLVEFGQAPTLVADAPNTASDLGMDANWLAWRTGADIHVNDYAQSATTTVVETPWNLDGPVRSIDLVDGALVAVQASSDGNRLWLQHLQTGETMLLPATPSNKLRDFATIARSGTVYTNFENKYYAILQSGFTESVITDFHVILSYEAAAANALLDLADERTAAHGDTLQFYLRPGDEFLRRGQYSYEIALSNGGDAANSGVTFDVAPMGDVNRDGTTNFLDYSILTNAFFSTTGDPEFEPAADLDNSGSINFLDIALFGAHFLDPDSADTALITWDTSLVAPGESVDVELTMIANQGARIKKTLRLTAQ